jgi:hypothetical protein
VYDRENTLPLTKYSQTYEILILFVDFL